MSILPLQGTEIATRWDLLYHFLLWTCVFFFILVIGAMMYFVIKFRARPGIKTKYITDSHLLEFAWTAIPTVLLMVLFVWGYVVYNDMTRSPADAYEVRVIARQWMFTFQYDDGRTTVNEVFVPINKPVRFVMTSEDVLHSFFIPDFRIKQDIVPGMYTSIWFESTMAGKHQVFCTEYCGASHSQMYAKVNVLTDEQWADWKRGKKLATIPDAREVAAAADRNADAGVDRVTSSAAAPIEALSITQVSLAEQGHRLTRSMGCVACHSSDGSPMMGPTLKGLYGRQVPLASGRTVLADDNYLRESIVEPQAKIVQGYPAGAMSTYKGRLTATEMNAVLAYIRSLK